MKRGWEIKKLGEICEFRNGLWVGKKPPFQKVSVIRNTNFTKDGKLNDSDIICLNVEQFQFSKKKLQYGDIILEKSGGGPKQPVGRVIIFNKEKGDFSFSNFTSAIRIINPKIVDFTYLHRFLLFSYVLGITESMQNHSTGIRNLKMDAYKAIEIPVPPLHEQQRIIAILDKAFAAIVKAKTYAEQNLQNAHDVFESYLQSVFSNSTDTWKIKKLGEVCEIINRGISPKYVDSEGICVLNQKCIREHRINFSLSRIHDIKNKEIRVEKFIQIGDVLVNSTGTGTLGRVAQVKNLLFPATVDSHLTIVRPIKNIFYSDFFGYALISIEPEIAKKGYGCGGQIELSRSTLKDDFTIIYPESLSEQKRIVTKLDILSTKTKKLEAIYQKKLANLEELKKSLLEKAFKGELTSSLSINKKMEILHE